VSSQTAIYTTHPHRMKGANKGVSNSVIVSVLIFFNKWKHIPKEVKNYHESIKLGTMQSSCSQWPASCLATAFQWCLLQESLLAKLSCNKTALKCCITTKLNIMISVKISSKLLLHYIQFFSAYIHQKSLSALHNRCFLT